MTLTPIFDPLDHETPELDIAVLRRLVTECCLGKRSIAIAEIGSWAGQSALAMLRAATVPCQIHCIDHWQGNPADRLGAVAERIGPDVAFATFCRNVGPSLFQSVFPHRGTSRLYASVWSLPLDLVFIDADHRYEHVKTDIEMWIKQLVPGGILCGHDYSQHFPGVVQAVNELGLDGFEGHVWWKRVDD